MSFCPPTHIHTRTGGKKKKSGREREGKKGGQVGVQVTVCWKTFAWNRNNEQVSSGKWSVLWGGWAGGWGGGVPQMSSPRNLSSNDFLFLWPTVRLWQIAAHLPRCVPGSQNIVKAVFLSCRSLQAPDSTPHQGSLITRSTLFWRENGGHPNWRRIMGGWNEDDSV